MGIIEEQMEEKFGNFREMGEKKVNCTTKKEKKKNNEFGKKTEKIWIEEDCFG